MKKVFLKKLEIVGIKFIVIMMAIPRWVLDIYKKLFQHFQSIVFIARY